MIHHVFDLDDTLIIHNNIFVNYDKISENNELTYLLNKCNGPCYIYTNGTGSHALSVIKKMNIYDKFEKIYSRDTIPYMKPYRESYNDVQIDLSYRYPEIKNIFFYDDRLENLKTAHEMGWITFWIHPNYLLGNKYHYINVRNYLIIKYLFIKI